MRFVKVSALALAAAVTASAVTAGDWTGGYVGAQLGFANVDTTVPGVNDTGAVYGLTMGYDYDMGDWVLGAGLDYDWSNITLGAVGVDNVGRLKLRAGYDMGDGLLYGTAGGARVYTTAGDDSGWFLGVGYEHKVSGNVSVGGELLYHRFDNFLGGPADIDATTLQIRTTFRF